MYFENAFYTQGDRNDKPYLGIDDFRMNHPSLKKAFQCDEDSS